MARAQPPTPQEERLWHALCEREGMTFVTAKGLHFSYTIRGNEMFISRKDKSITRATVNIAYRNARRLVASEGGVSGPKQLGTFGASYLYPVFVAMGIIPVMQAQLRMNLEGLSAAQARNAGQTKEEHTMNRDKMACTCKEVTYGKLMDAVARGASTYDEVQAITKFGTGCGRCKEFIECFIKELVEERDGK